MSVKVLIVEDEPVMMNLFKEMLAKGNYEILEAEGVTKAFEIIETKKPQVAIIDIRLGDGSGMTILENIRRKRMDIEVIMVTLILTDESFEIGARKLGVHSFFYKPFDIDEFTDAVKDATKRFL